MPRLGDRIGSELGQHFSHRALDRRASTTARSQGGPRYSHPRFKWRSRRKPDGEDATTAPDETPIGQRAAAEGGKPSGHSPGWGSPVWQADSSDEEDDSGGVGAVRNGKAERKSSISHILTPDGKAFRPHRIILVRHGQSEGNVDEAAYTRIPDSKIALTKK
ncbi:unnamed protein product, partial [Closterium sp. NIES-54]